MAIEDLHQPVLLNEVIAYLNPVDGGIYVDGNLGLGGHSAKIISLSAPTGKVIGFDWDEEAMQLAKQRLAKYGDRVIFMRRNFADMVAAVTNLGVSQVDGVLLDLGLSSMQLDAGNRGFSFKNAEPLDMRMDTSITTTAADIVNTASKDELADIFYYYGEERQARRIADFIVQERKKKPVSTTEELVDIIKRAVPRRFYPQKIHVATKTFQALRIAVNRELDNLSRALREVPQILKEEARFCVISFHSLEDRLVKQAFQQNRELKILTKKPIMAGIEECNANPRARSAKLRVAEMRRVK